MRRRVALLSLVVVAAFAGCGGDATDDDVVASVPADARAYLHVDRGSGDWESATEALARLPSLAGPIRELLAGSLEVPGDGEAGVALLPGRRDPVVVKPNDPLSDLSLADLQDYKDLLRGLPDERFVHGYLAPAATGFLRPLDGSIRSVVAAADLDGDTMQIRARVRHEGRAGPCYTSTGDPLVEIADPEAAFYVEMPSVGCALRALGERFTGVDDALAAFGRAAKRRGGVSLDDEVLPLLEGRGALIASPGDPAPVLTFVLDGVDERQALDVVSRLQPALLHLIDQGQSQVSIGSADVAGVTAVTAQLAPGLQLSYAAWDGRLVVSTALKGIASVRKEDGLPGTDAFDSVFSDSPESLTALVFLDLNQLLTLGEQAGLAEDPRYLAVRDDLQKLRAAGAVVSREENFTTAELTFQIP